MPIQAQGGLDYPRQRRTAAGGGRIAAVAQVGILALTVLTLLLLIGSDFTRACGRVCCRGADGGDGRIADCRGAGSAGDLYRAGTAEPGSLHPDGVCEEVGQERRGGDEVLPLRRHVGGVSAVWVQLSLRNCGIDESAPRSCWRLYGSNAVHAAPLLYVALVMIAAGLGFKVAAVPFHLWAPDTYEGAPAPAAAFIASVSKVASFALLISIGTAAWHVFDGCARRAVRCRGSRYPERRSRFISDFRSAWIADLAGAGGGVDGAGKPGGAGADERAQVAGLLGDCACRVHSAGAGVLLVLAAERAGDVCTTSSHMG